MFSAERTRTVRPLPARSRRRGFTLIEAMAAVALLGIGIAGAMGAIGSMTRTESQARLSEHLYTLAQEKLAELQATGQATTSSNGTFEDQNEPDSTWTLDVNTSGITDLDAITLTVETKGSPVKVKLDTLLYVPPQSSNTAGGTTQ